MDDGNNNSYFLPLANGQTFTGVADDVYAYSPVGVAVKTDKSGVLYMEFSPDNINWDSSLSFQVASNSNEVHRLSVTRRADSGSRL